MRDIHGIDIYCCMRREVVSVWRLGLRGARVERRAGRRRAAGIALRVRSRRQDHGTYIQVSIYMYRRRHSNLYISVFVQFLCGVQKVLFQTVKVKV